MAKMWAGRTSGEMDVIADKFNQCIGVDQRMYEQDIKGSMAHATMLGATGIIPKAASEHIIDALAGILEDLKSGKLDFDETAEDIHMFVEQILTERIGDEGKMLHTARSRNDQVALDLRLYLKDEIQEIIELIKELLAALSDQAESHKATIMPGYTHLQRAQPITLGHHLMAYSMMFLRDIGRFQDTLKRMWVSPIGSCALAGTTYPTDRIMEANLLGFDEVMLNSLDGVSDRDYCIELMNAIATCMMHMSRLSEEIILWASWEFKFIELADSYTTGSSIMPQKKNPDMAELVRGKTGRVYGDLFTLLTVLKGIPLAYNKDMQEDKEPVFDSVDTIKDCLKVFAPMVATLKVNEGNMMKAAQKGFINATDLADYMVKKGLPFRSAYKISGQIVAECIKEDMTLETMSLDAYKKYWDGFDEELYDAVDLTNCVNRRSSLGGTSVESVEMQIEYIRNKISEL